MNVKEWLSKAENTMATQVQGSSGQMSDGQKDQFRVGCRIVYSMCCENMKQDFFF